MSAKQNEALVRRFFDELCNNRKLNVAAEIFSADHAYHDPQETPSAKGPEGVRQVIATYQTAIPDAHWHVDETFATDEVVITRWRGTGTQKKELHGIPATGKYVEVQGLWLHRCKNGKIVESYNSWDTLGMLQQLGVVPALETAS